MKQIQLILFLALCLVFNATAQIFVKQDATGIQDGSSWENAFTDLQTAIDAAEAGNEIWIAKGTYLAPLDTSIYETYGGFRIDKEGLSLYGGFEGNESSLTERSIADALTILSGDLNGDDVENDFTINKSDNTTRVLYIDSLLEAATLLSGLTFSGGNSVSDTELPYDWRSGGGVFTYSPVQILDCSFHDNFALSGASINLFGNRTVGSLISNTNFSNNLTTNPDGQAVVLMVSTADVEMENCDFKNNVVSRGAVYTLFCDNIAFKNCDLEGNENLGGFGGAIWNWNSTNIFYDSCSFKNNVATNGGVIYNDGRSIETLSVTFQNCSFEENSTTDFGGGAIYNWQGHCEFKGCMFKGNQSNNGGVIYNDGREHNRLTAHFDDCIFEENKAVGWGAGAIYNWRATYKVENCEFRENTAASTAGVIYSSNIGSNQEIKNCIFENNAAFGGWGGSIASYTDVVGSIENCTFKENSASTSGGAIILGFKSNVDIKDCDFESNDAQFGGAIFLQNDTTAANIDNATFIENLTTSFGGAIVLSGGGNLSINRSEFIENSSNIGGAISTFIDTLIRPKLNIQNTIFASNIAATQGGAVNLFNADAFFNNCLFSTNFADGNGIGGAISNNGFDGYHSELTLINSTVASNIASTGGIAQFAGAGEIDSATTSLQNTIIANNIGGNYVNEDGNTLARIISLGGNISSDETLESDLTHEKDQNATDPIFIDEFDDFHLQEGSPAINAGVESAYVLAHDLAGNERMGVVDVGAYEFQMISNTTYLEETNTLEIFPNPTKEKVFIHLEHELSGEFDVYIVDVNGKEVMRRTIEKRDESLQIELNIEHLFKGGYQVIVVQEEEIVSATLMKI